MTTIATLYIIIALVLINSLLDHLFSWWFKEWEDCECIVVPIFIYIGKVGLVIAILYELIPLE